MSITSKCNGCGATSLGGVLSHMPSCLAVKPQIMRGHIMPSMTITFDKPEDQLKFAKSLTGSAGGTAVTGLDAADSGATNSVSNPPKPATPPTPDKPKTRKVPPRIVVERPQENYNHLEKEELQKLLDVISGLCSDDLEVVMSTLCRGLVRQRDAATYRAVDFETAVANCAMRPSITPKTWGFILKEFIEPHESALRMPALIDWISKRIDSRLGTKAKDVV